MTPEATSEILKQFEMSWDKTEQFYNTLVYEYKGWGRLMPLLQFIRDKRSEGEQRHFRLGTSVHHLIISRSVDHGLRPDQKSIQIISENDKFRVVFINGDVLHSDFTVESLEDERLSNLLLILKNTLLD
ncbi:hypothetical protein ACLI1A_03185 [Flavobacterium sp. RHBU_3]|uniref:hypothetical protein n=1 Tax=Flavobacterium sp. RHBU_3 TaxID=3391184 RepID=UPI0039848BBB